MSDSEANNGTTKEGQSKQLMKSKKPKEIPAKDMEIQHYKLGKVKLGDISKNEMCRMVQQLIYDKQNLTNQVTLANMILDEFKQGDVREAQAKVNEKLKKQLEIKKTIKDTKPADS